MATKAKETLSADVDSAKPIAETASLSKGTAEEKTKKRSTRKTTAKAATTKKTKSRTASSRTASKADKSTAEEQTTKDVSVEANEAVAIPPETALPVNEQMQTQMPLNEAIAASKPSVEASPSQAESTDDAIATNEHFEQPDSSPLTKGAFLAADCISDDIWIPSAAIPSLDEATYQAQKEQAEAQRRAIEVASLNLKNINDLHRLERQSVDVAISTKENETRSAQLASAEIDYQIQVETNGEKSQALRQATARKEAAVRESDYADQLIALKDQNFELDIQQAQNIFAEKAARYRAQLTGQ